MSTPAVCARGVTVAFGNHRAISDLSFDIAEGEFVTIVGPNGSGKSTLLKTLIGVIKPTSGAAFLFDRAPRTVPPAWIGYVPQIKTFERSFPAMSIEVVLTGLHRRWPFRISTSDRSRATEALEAVGAGHLVNRAIGRLSGGELQRVYLARSLIRNPRLVLLDEPAAGIDVVGEYDLYRLLDAYRRRTNVTVVMVTHDWEVVYHHATNALLINSAQIAYGPPSDAFSDDALRRAFGHIGHAHPMVTGGSP